MSKTSKVLKSGVLMTKKKFDLLSEEQKGVLKNLSQKHLERLVRETKQDNEKSIGSNFEKRYALIAKVFSRSIKKVPKGRFNCLKKHYGKAFYTRSFKSGDGLPCGSISDLFLTA